MTPAYFAKNGPIDDMSELLLVKGLAPYVYGGATSGSETALGLADLFTTVSSGLLNINTASAQTLQVLPEVDEVVAHGIVAARAGPDGVEGNADDMPFRNPAELARVPGFSPQMVSIFQSMLSVRSVVFDVRVEARLGRESRYFQAMIWRKIGGVEVLRFSQE